MKYGAISVASLKRSSTDCSAVVRAEYSLCISSERCLENLTSHVSLAYDVYILNSVNKFDLGFICRQ